VADIAYVHRLVARSAARDDQDRILRYAFIDDYQDAQGVETICRVLLKRISESVA
jgi:hypothetical protein